MSFKKEHLGSNFDELMEEEKLSAEINAIAVKRVLAFKLRETMEKEGINKSQMAEKMHTSRSALERFLDHNNISITLTTMEKAARAIGKRLEIKLKSA